ncbi:Rrn7 protein [Saccharomycopsis crataegensis]|uniref:Rrn7 protein n=1 Tax=Saccharomycopsis crataegensis TaxID=43959 RepID=A0AAV5QSX8_9ASCO|nr:Rrn7 protein [Saccharomycopsis crataegensis]
MSSVLVRGPICGVDNCNSQLWRSIEGRRVCQYGHIREGDVEIGEDDEQFVLTRKLTVPSLNSQKFSQMQYTQELKNQKEQSKHKLYGMPAKIRFLECYQHVLKAQVKWLVENRGLPDAFEKVVKELWIVYLELMYYEDEGHYDMDDETTDGDESETTIYTDGESLYPLAEDDTEVIETSGKKRKKTVSKKRKNKKKQNQKKNYSVSLIHSLCLCYLACLILRFPLFANDFIRLCAVNKLPFIKASLVVPKELLKGLPDIYMTRLEPNWPPLAGEFYNATREVLQSLQACLGENSITNEPNNEGFYIRSSAFSNLEIDYEILLMKVVKELVLPRELYIIIKNFINFFDLKFGLATDYSIASHNSMNTKIFVPYSKFPELRLISIIISMTKFYFISQNFLRGSNNKKGKLQVLNWEVWIELFYKKKYGSQYSKDQADISKSDEEFDHTLNYISANGHKVDELELLNFAFGIDMNSEHTGSDNILDKYLVWFDNTLIKYPRERDTLKISERRLVDLFDTGATFDEGEEKPKIIEDLSLSKDEGTTSNTTSPTKCSDKTFIDISEVKLISFKDVLKIENLLVGELSTNFGISVERLKRMVNSWSDKLLVTAL